MSFVVSVRVPILHRRCLKVQKLRQERFVSITCELQVSPTFAFTKVNLCAFYNTVQSQLVQLLYSRKLW